MNKYEKSAIFAARLLAEKPNLTPRCAWKNAVTKIFPDSPSSQNKGCPRDAFLGICELGVIPNVPQGIYTRSVKNKSYVVNALHALRSNPKLTIDELWKIAVGNIDKKHNGQMNVLMALARNGFLQI